MNRLTALLLVVSLLLSSSVALAQQNHHLDVANWSFDVVGAVKSPTLTGPVHLGALQDGRHWLVITMLATNTSSEEREIRSDKIQLRVDGEMVKQTGDESQGAAVEMGYTSIGGPSPHGIDPGRELQVVQVYKIAPGASDFTLVFDFNGK